TRESLWKIRYIYYQLNPKAQISLVIQNSDKTLREIKINTKLVKWEDWAKELTNRKKKLKYSPFECKTIENETIVCRFKSFEVDTDDVDKLMKTVSQNKNLILDLRKNGGGYTTTLKHFLGYFFDKDIKIGTKKTRKELKDELVKTQGKRVFVGKLTVLIDSNSGSASEIFARVMQIEKRGTIIGDVSSGAVMESVGIVKTLAPMAKDLSIARDWTDIPYMINITVADLRMTDGKSLEKVGVKPDVFIVPTGLDLALNQDVALAKAASLFDIKLDAESAGKLFQKTIDDDEN
nr:S41 family peptidase [Pyrinomonadaceae bacterium]